MDCMWLRGLNKKCGRPATRNLLGVAPVGGKDRNPTCESCAERLKKSYGFASEPLDSGHSSRDGQ